MVSKQVVSGAPHHVLFPAPAVQVILLALLLLVVGSLALLEVGRRLGARSAGLVIMYSVPAGTGARAVQLLLPAGHYQTLLVPGAEDAAEGAPRGPGAGGDQVVSTQVPQALVAGASSLGVDPQSHQEAPTRTKPNAADTAGSVPKAANGAAASAKPAVAADASTAYRRAANKASKPTTIKAPTHKAKLAATRHAKPAAAAVRTGAEAAAATVISKGKASATKASQKRASGTGSVKVKAGAVAQARR